VVEVLHNSLLVELAVLAEEELDQVQGLIVPNQRLDQLILLEVAEVHKILLVNLVVRVL
jgi:hypothetical protein